MIRALDTSKISRRLKEKADDQSESKHLTSSRVLKVFQDHSDKYEGFCGDATEFSKKENIHNVADELRTTFHTLNSRIDEELAKADEASCFSVASTDNTTVINTSKTKLSLPMFLCSPVIFYSGGIFGVCSVILRTKKVTHGFRKDLPSPFIYERL